jgi:hypothetical protein
MTSVTAGALAGARKYGVSVGVADAIQDANPATAGARLALAREYGLSEWAVAGIETVSPTAPSRPVNAHAVAGTAGKATVSFDTPDDGGEPITSYTVTSSVGAVTGTGTKSPVAMTGLTAGAQTFTVTATNSLGTSPASPASNSITVL